MTAAVTAVLICAGAACAQSLYLVESAPAERSLAPGGQLHEWSMISVAPPEPRVFQVHDLVTIIIDENTLQKAEETLETKKKVDSDAGVGALLDIEQLFELRLEEGNLDGLTLYDLIANQNYDGEGEFERKDEFQGRITAEVLDVKPNGTLVLEAKMTIDKDGEKISLVASGVCRGEDVTEQNTVLSTQLANKMLVTRHEGEVRKGSKKGWITRAFDTIFAF